MSLSPRAASLVVVVALGLSASAPASADDRSTLEQQRQGVAGQIEGARQAYDESTKAFFKAR